MTLSIWRFAHLALATISAAFLLILSLTGVVLAIDAVQEKSPSYKVDHFKDLSLAQVIPTLRENYFEILEVKVDHNDFVTIDALDEDGKSIKAYIDPRTGKELGKIVPKSDFIEWTTALHRSLFLKETGRAIVGVVSFLLFLITLSGLILIIKRQQGIKHFFAKVNKDFFAQYFHVVTGRWLLIPILTIAISGTLLFALRLDFVKVKNTEIKHESKTDETIGKEIKDIDFFKNTKLYKVERIEFPFVPDDPAEPFIIHLRDKTISVNQINGDLLSESRFSYTAALEKFSLDLHTGRTNILWAIILGLASLNIVFFIYSGFVITFRRTKTKIKNKIKPQDAEIILLVGSENGTTLFFANKVHKQLLSEGKKSYLAEMNQYQTYNQAKHLVVFTSTYGLGEAPSNATRFVDLVNKFPQSPNIDFSVVGFGSIAYEEFCAYASHVDEVLQKQSWANRILDVHTVNDRSTDEFVTWAQAWSEKTLHALATAPAVYSFKIPNLQKFVVTKKTATSEDNSTFILTLQPKGKNDFTSGDLLAVYPADDHRERFYSIGKVNNEIQLVVKLFPNGFGSGYLNGLTIGATISARVMKNTNFHLPLESKRVAMIANGTGIAPFLGMIESNSDKKEIHLYTGFRNENSLIATYKAFAERMSNKNQLKTINFAFSREERKLYVMDLIERDAEFFAKLLKEGGTIMICGSLNMQKDVEVKLNTITEKINNQNLDHYFKNKQIRTDCY